MAVPSIHLGYFILRNSPGTWWDTIGFGIAKLNLFMDIISHKIFLFKPYWLKLFFKQYCIKSIVKTPEHNPDTLLLSSLLKSQLRIITFLPINTPHLPLKRVNTFIYSFDNKIGNIKRSRWKTSRSGIKCGTSQKKKRALQI